MISATAASSSGPSVHALAGLRVEVAHRTGCIQEDGSLRPPSPLHRTVTKDLTSFRFLISEAQGFVFLGGFFIGLS